MFPYAGLPLILGALIIVCANRMDGFTILLRGLIIIFGYIAAILDLKSKRIPNQLILAMLASWVLVMTPKLFFDTAAAVGMLIDSALGFAIGGCIFLLVYIVSHKGLGGGDVKFMAAAGLYLGLKNAIPAMLYGTILAALTGLTLIILKRINRKDKIPLAPFLYIGILITVFFQ